MTPDNAKSENKKRAKEILDGPWPAGGCGGGLLFPIKDRDIPKQCIPNLGEAIAAELDARDRAHAELELKEVTKLRQEVKDLKLTIAAKERMIKAKQVVIDSGCDEYAKLEAELSAAREERDRLKENADKVMCVYCGFTAKKDANVMADHIIKYCEKRPDSLVNMTKVLEDFKGLEKSLQEMIAANDLAEFEIGKLRAALVEKDKAFKSITQWGFTADQRKFEGNHKKVIKMIVQIAQEALTPEAAGKAQEKDGGV